MNSERWLLFVLFVFLVVTMFTCDTWFGVTDQERGPSDAYILVPDGMVTPQWGYQQLPMKECAWCKRTVNLNRHHVIPQAANPALRDVKENLVVLCRDCHFVLGHRCDWRQYNPDVLYICTHFTNVIRSSDTRYTLTNGVNGRVEMPAPQISPPETPENKGDSGQVDESDADRPKLVHPEGGAK